MAKAYHERITVEFLWVFTKYIHFYFTCCELTLRLKRESAVSELLP